MIRLKNIYIPIPLRRLKRTTMTTTYNNLMNVNTKHMASCVAYDLLSREAESKGTTLKQYVAIMKQHIVAKDKEMTAWERKLKSGAIPLAERAKSVELWEQCKKECFQLSKLSSLYGQHENWLRDINLIKPTKTVEKVKKISKAVKVEVEVKVVVEPLCEEDEWEMNATNFAI